jgi:5-methylcytosine-specific restriction endonuclease McrA
VTLERRTPLERRTRLRPRSAKRAALYREQRVPLVRELLAARPVCERCHAAASVDVHEIQTRARGGSLLDPENLAALCRPCHDWIGREPRAATDEGWLRPSSR